MPQSQPVDLPTGEVVGALVEYQRRTVDLYVSHASEPETCIKALVRLHLAWTEEDPERAKLVARYRGPVMAGPGKEKLTEANVAYFEHSKRWMKEATASGAMPAVSFNVLHALVFAPTQELAKHWLGGRLKKRPTEYAEAMGAAAWAGILAAGGALESAAETDPETTADAETGASS